MDFDRAMFVVALLGLGTAAIFFYTDRRSSATRALCVGLGCTGLALLQATLFPVQEFTGFFFRFADVQLEGIAILAGLEYGRRIALQGEGRSIRAAIALLRAAQILTLVFCLIAFIFLLVLPDMVRPDADEFIALRPLQWAVYVPLLGTATLLALIAMVLLHVGKIDSVERIRLRALSFSGGFFLASLALGDTWVPIVMTLGFIVLIGGSIEYFQVQSQRGVFMREFLPPEVANVLDMDGLAALEERQRVVVTALFVDLRGFTSFASQVSSDQAIAALERYYSVVGEVAAKHGGMVKDHAGDGVLVLLGVPIPTAGRCQAAIAMAAAIQADLQALLPEIDKQLGAGIGVASGKVSAGAIHGAGRMEYVAVGSAVNLAARLSDLADNGEVLLDRLTAEELEPVALDAGEDLRFKGFADPIRVYRLRRHSLSAA